MRISGPSPTNKWGSFLWGQNWGESQDGYFTVTKYLANGVALSSDMATAQITKYLSSILSIASRINFGYLADGSGYYYVFPDNVTDPDNRFFPTWTESTEPSTSFTAASEPSTTWTDA